MAVAKECPLVPEQAHTSSPQPGLSSHDFFNQPSSYLLLRPLMFFSTACQSYLSHIICLLPVRPLQGRHMTEQQVLNICFFLLHLLHLYLLHFVTFIPLASLSSALFSLPYNIKIQMIFIKFAHLYFLKRMNITLWPHVCTPGTVFHYLWKFAGEFEYYLDSAVTSNTKPQLMGSAEFSSHCSLAQ